MSGAEMAGASSRGPRCRRGRRGRCPALLVGLLVAFLCHPGFAASSGDEIRIEEIELQLDGDWLVISAACRDLFSREAISTIESGLAAAVYVDVRLMKVGRAKSLFSGGGRTYTKVSSVELVSSIAYSIWDERYLVRSGAEATTYAELDRAVESIGRIRHRIPVSELPSMTDHAARLRARVVPISAAEGDRAADRRRNPSRLERDLSAEEQAAGMQLSLDRLVSVFGGGKKRARNSSEWHTSEPFRIGESGELLK